MTAEQWLDIAIGFILATALLGFGFGSFARFGSDCDPDADLLEQLKGKDDD